MDQEMIKNEDGHWTVPLNKKNRNIRRILQPEQWLYLATNDNAADQETRHVSACELQYSSWLQGLYFYKELRRSIIQETRHVSACELQYRSWLQGLYFL